MMKKKLVIVIDYFLILIACLITTELFAYLCNYPDIFGGKDLVIFYDPFKIFVWTFTLRTPFAETAIAYSVFAFMVITIITVSIVIYKRYSIEKTDTYGSSRWLKNLELKKLGLLAQGGVILGQTNTASYHYTPEKDEYSLTKPGDLIFNNGKEHLLIVAPTRRGKGINFVVPSLLSWLGSVVVYDIKKENFDITSGWRKKFSRVIRFEPAAKYSARFNPLFEIEKGPKEIAHAQNIASIISDPNGSGESDHWQKTAQQLLVGIIIHLLYAGENKTLAGIYEFLNNPAMPIRKTLDTMLETKHLGHMTHPVVAQAARNLLNKSDNELSGVVSTASSYLSLYQDPYIQQNTAVSDFTINQLMHADNPMSLYLVVSPQDSDRMKPLLRLILQMIGKKLTERLGGYKHRLLFLIDEFPTLGNLEFFETQLAFFAGYGIKCALITQSFNQLYKFYTKTTSIMDNCRYKLILGADNPIEAKLISDYLGQETLVKKSSSKSGKMSGFIMSNKSVSESEAGRYLMTPDEVLRLSFEDILLLCGGTFPYKGKKIMYFIDKRFKDRANLPKPESKEEQEKEFLTSDRSVWLNMKPVKPIVPIQEQTLVTPLVHPEIEQQTTKTKNAGQGTAPVTLTVKNYNPLGL